MEEKIIGTDKYILAFDTTGASLSVAVIQNKIIIAEKLINVSNQHSVNLLPALDSLMQEINISYDQLSAIAVTQGPGSFTGIRIGISTANSMAYGLDIPVIGLSSLEVLAEPLKNAPGIVLPAFDARGGRVFAAAFRHGLRLCEDKQFVDLELPKLIREKYLSEEILIIGDGFKIVQNLLSQNDLRGIRIDSNLNKNDYISAGVLGLLAERKISRNPDFYLNGYRESVLPNYCVLSQAERNLLRQND